MHGPLNVKICMAIGRTQTMTPATSTPFSCKTRTAAAVLLQLLWERLNNKLGGSIASCSSVTDAKQTTVLAYFLQFHINFILTIAMTGNPTATTASSLLKDSQLGFGVRPASYSTGTTGLFLTPPLPPGSGTSPFKPRIKSHLLFAGIIRSSPFSPR